MLFTPLDQFDITPITILLFNQLDYSTQNIVTVFLILVFALFYFFWTFAKPKTKLVDFHYYIVNALTTLVKDITHSKLVATGFFNVYIMLIFMIIALANWSGLIAFGYTITALIFVPFLLSILSFVIPNYAAYKKFNVVFLSFFKPSGISWVLKPMLIIIELISHTMRVLSLAVRLFANMFAGHVLIFILCSTILLAAANPFMPIFGALALKIVYLVIYSLEAFIAILQAYVFTALVGIYLTETMDH